MLVRHFDMNKEDVQTYLGIQVTFYTTHFYLVLEHSTQSMMLTMRPDNGCFEIAKREPSHVHCAFTGEHGNRL